MGAAGGRGPARRSTGDPRAPRGRCSFGWTTGDRLEGPRPARLRASATDDSSPASATLSGSSGPLIPSTSARSTRPVATSPAADAGSIERTVTLIEGAVRGETHGAPRRQPGAASGQTRPRPSAARARDWRARYGRRRPGAGCGWRARPADRRPVSDEPARRSSNGWPSSSSSAATCCETANWV